MSRTQEARSSLFGALFFPALIVGVLIIVAILVMSFSGGQRAVSASNSNSNSDVRQLSHATLKQFQNRFDVLGMSMGAPNAPVTIREFGDYQCPACGHFAPTAERIRDQFVKTGRARFIFFDFPLPMHAHAQAAAVAARCAARQHKFWPYHNKLYNNQDRWAEKNNPTSAFLDLAVEAGVNTNRLQRCIAQDATTAEIKQEKAAGKAIKLRATPTVIVGKTLFSGAPSYARVKQIVNRLAPTKKKANTAGNNHAKTADNKG